MPQGELFKKMIMEEMEICCCFMLHKGCGSVDSTSVFQSGVACGYFTETIFQPNVR